MVSTNLLHRVLWPTAVVVVFCAAASLSTAQVPEEETPPVPATLVPPEVAPVEDQKIDQFAEAYLEIEEIHAIASAELDAAESPTEADDVKERADGKIIQAVKRSGLELDEFNQIAERTAVDGELRARIERKVAERRRI